MDMCILFITMTFFYISGLAYNFYENDFVQLMDLHIQKRLYSDSRHVYSFYNKEFVHLVDFHITSFCDNDFILIVAMCILFFLFC